MSGRAVPRTSSSPASRRISNGIRANTRPATAGVAKLLLLGLSQIGRVVGAPVREYFTSGHGEGPDDSLPKSPQDPDLWILLTVAMILVLAGGAFAGLTIA
jgi:metal transporter CNNM